MSAQPTDDALEAAVVVAIREHEATDCFRCPEEPAGRIDPLEPDAGLCSACRDEVAHAAELRRWAWHWEGHDENRDDFEVGR